MVWSGRRRRRTRAAPTVLQAVVSAARLRAARPGEGHHAFSGFGGAQRRRGGPAVRPRLPGSVRRRGRGDRGRRGRCTHRAARTVRRSDPRGQGGRRLAIGDPGLWRFDGFVLDTQRYELRHGDEVVRVEPQVFDVLTQLVSNRERCVTKEELFDAVWGGRFVGEAALTSRIKAARRALGDDGESQRFIRTVRGRGYQFVGTLVDDTAVAPAPAPEPAPPRQHIAFCHAADG